jgi:2-oxoglutarate ferredoxin oxidoreductase subunit beta
MTTYLKDNAINISAWNKLPKEKKIGKFIVGEIYNNKRAEYTEEYDKIIKSL